MANRTAWTAGNGVGFTWTTLINGSDLTSLASGSSVLSSVAAIANQTNLDTFMDVGIEMTVGSATPSAGANFALYVMYLNEDGTIYGGGEYASTGSGGAITRAPAGFPVNFPIQSTVATTLMAGIVTGIPIYPGSFVCALYNGTGVALSATAGNNVVKYRTYNINLNN